MADKARLYARQAEYRARKRALRGFGLVDAAPIRERICQLNAFGMTCAEIDRAAGLSATCKQVLDGQPTVRKSTAEAVLSVRSRRALSGTLISREAMDRRIIEMLEEGYPLSTQGKLSGITANTIRSDAKTVRASTMKQYLAATEKALTEWNTEPTRSQNAARNYAVKYAATVDRKWKESPC